MAWDAAAAGVLTLPSGRLVRGRGVGSPLPAGPEPEFGVYLLGRRPAVQPWESRWVTWPDFRLPWDPGDLWAALADVLGRADSQRVEVACRGGHGRTGTALACLAVLDGLAADRAVAYVRDHYRSRAVETPRAAGVRCPVPADSMRPGDDDDGRPRPRGTAGRRRPPPGHRPERARGGEEGVLPQSRLSLR
ncbi:Protein-tyrosine phosphatase [Modestobacter sp. DSM 44400]|nr:Protein-tyrosine phosphatase [Modestobacter sp. DSM 44400]